MLGASSLELKRSLSESESPKRVWTHLISPASVSLTLKSNLMQIHPVWLRLSQIHAVSLGFTGPRVL